MSTPSELEQQGVLEKIDGGLEPGESPARYLYALPRATKWLKEEMPNYKPDGYIEGAATLEGQADFLFYQFCVGDLISKFPPHSMDPKEKYVWELRTPDLRFFGWFWRRSFFIIADVDTKERCNKYKLYAGYRDQAVRTRDALALDEPKCVTGEINDVL